MFDIVNHCAIVGSAWLNTLRSCISLRACRSCIYGDSNVAKKSLLPVFFGISIESAYVVHQRSMCKFVSYISHKYIVANTSLCQKAAC